MPEGLVGDRRRRRPPGGHRHEAEANAVAVQALRHGASNEGALRSHVGGLLGFDFSGVRVHRDDPAVAAEGAHAVTSGADVRLAPGRFRPDLPLGRALLAHELTHVAQQGAALRLGDGPGRYAAALAERRRTSPSEELARRAPSLREPRPDLTPAPRGMRQRCITGCRSCEGGETEEAGSTSAGGSTTPATPPTPPTPTHAVGPSAASAGHRVIRLSWTVDDGPTTFTPGMSSALSPRAATWFIMSNQLGTGSARTTALQQLVRRQSSGDEIAVHSMHPTTAHSAWFPISLDGVPQGYTTTTSAMADLTTFTNELRGEGLRIRFARMPGGELSEVKKYVETQGGSASTSEPVAEALLADRTPPTPAPTQVQTDVRLVKTTLSALSLHLWGGSASGPEIERTSWEAESSGVPARTNDVVRRFKGVVDRLASGSRRTPASFIILAHDTTQADVTQTGTNVSEMETYATGKDVRVEYYRISDLYQIVRGTSP